MRPSCKIQVNYSQGKARLHGRFSVSTLRDSLGFAAESRPVSTKKTVQTEPTGAIFPRFRHVFIARAVQAVWRWSELEDGLDQQPRYLIYTKHKNTEHQVRLNILMSTHPQVAHSDFVLETAIQPFNRSLFSIALNCRMDKTGSVGRFTFFCQRFLQALVAARDRVDDADTVMLSWASG